MRFLKIKAMYDVSTLGIKYPKEDLHFWYEVQKYKVRLSHQIGRMVHKPLNRFMKLTPNRVREYVGQCDA